MEGSSSGLPANCVVCWRNFSLLENGEQKPLVHPENVEGVLEEFKVLLRSFKRLSCGGGGEDVGDYVAEHGALEELFGGREWRSLWSSGEALRLPCCGKCWAGLKEVKRLQEEIDQLKVKQRQHLEHLKDCLLNSENEDNGSGSAGFWCQVRSQLSKCVQTKRAVRTPPPLPLDLEEEQEEEPVFSPPHSPALLSDPLAPDPVFPASSKAAASFGFQKVCKKLKLKKTKPPLKSSVEDLTAQMRPCSVVVPRLQPDNRSDINQLILGPNKFLVPKEKSEYQKPNLFHLVRDNLLLFKFTLIQVSHGGTQLACLEPGCNFSASHFQNNLVTFQQLAEHVKSSHCTISQRHAEVRKCPLCSEEHPRGRKFRLHLLQGHNLKKTVCEVCYKPISNTGCKHRKHRWYHLTKTERNAIFPKPRWVCEYKTVKKRQFQSVQTGSNRTKKPKMQNLEVKPEVKTEHQPDPGDNFEKARRSCRQKTDAVLDKLVQEENRDNSEEDNVDDDEEYVPSPSSLAPSDEFEDIALEPEHFKEPEPKPEINCSAVNGTMNKRHNLSERCLFYHVTGQIYLQHYTLLKIVPGQGIYCLEPECSSPRQLTTDTTPENLHQAVLHVKTHHPGASFDIKIRKCVLCRDGHNFQVGRNFRRHFLEKKHAPCRVLCENCLQHFKNFAELKKHMAINWKPKKKIVAREPKKDFSIRGIFHLVRDSVYLHKFTLLRMTPDQGIFCLEPECSGKSQLATDTTYKSLQLAKLHVKKNHPGTHFDTKTRKCGLCPDERVFTVGRNFLRHFLARTHAPCQVLCEKCWQHFSNVESLAKHLETEHGIRRLIKLPGQRKKRIQPVKKVKEKQISLIRPFKCPECPKTFQRAFQLRYHSETHLPKHLRERFTCPHCPALFVDQVCVRNHIERIHSENKRVKHCPICNKEFFWRDETRLQNHLRMHRNERPFVCDLCGMAFFNNSFLNLHRKRVHTEEKNFQCEFCAMTYKHPKSLTRHKMAQHKEMMTKEIEENRKKKICIQYQYTKEFIGPKIAFPCQVCDKIFELRSRLKKHLQGSHPETWKQVEEKFK